MALDFFTPIDYLNHGKGFSSSLQMMADNYFFYGNSAHRAYLIEVENDTFYVQLLPCEANCWKTAIKMASLATLVIPLIMLIIKVIGRLGKEFKILNVSELSCEPKNGVVLTPIKPESNWDPTVDEARYKAMFEESGIEYSEATALQKHVAFFADEKGQITRQSMQEGFNRLRLGAIKSWLLSWVVFKGLASSTESVDGVIRLQDISKGKHLSDTEIFTADGEFDSASFDRLGQFAKTAPELLTADEFAQMRASNRKRDQDLSGATAGAIASKGEFDLMLSLFADRYVIDAFGTATPAMSFERLRSMYIDGPLLFEEVAQT